MLRNVKQCFRIEVTVLILIYIYYISLNVRSQKLKCTWSNTVPLRWSNYSGDIWTVTVNKGPLFCNSTIIWVYNLNISTVAFFLNTSIYDGKHIVKCYNKKYYPAPVICNFTLFLTITDVVYNPLYLNDAKGHIDFYRSDVVTCHSDQLDKFVGGKNLPILAFAMGRCKKDPLNDSIIHVEQEPYWLGEEVGVGCKYIGFPLKFMKLRMTSNVYLMTIPMGNSFIVDGPVELIMYFVPFIGSTLNLPIDCINLIGNLSFKSNKAKTMLETTFYPHYPTGFHAIQCNPGSNRTYMLQYYNFTTEMTYLLVYQPKRTIYLNTMTSYKILFYFHSLLGQSDIQAICGEGGVVFGNTFNTDGLPTKNYTIRCLSISTSTINQSAYIFVSNEKINLQILVIPHTTTDEIEYFKPHKIFCRVINSTVKFTLNISGLNLIKLPNNSYAYKKNIWLLETRQTVYCNFDTALGIARNFILKHEVDLRYHPYYKVYRVPDNKTITLYFSEKDNSANYSCTCNNGNPPNISLDAFATNKSYQITCKLGTRYLKTVTITVKNPYSLTFGPKCKEYFWSVCSANLTISYVDESFRTYKAKCVPKPSEYHLYTDDLVQFINPGSRTELKIKCYLDKTKYFSVLTLKVNKSKNLPEIKIDPPKNSIDLFLTNRIYCTYINPSGLDLQMLVTDSRIMHQVNGTDITLSPDPDYINITFTFYCKVDKCCQISRDIFLYVKSEFFYLEVNPLYSIYILGLDKTVAFAFIYKRGNSIVLLKAVCNNDRDPTIFGDVLNFKYKGNNNVTCKRVNSNFSVSTILFFSDQKYNLTIHGGPFSNLNPDQNIECLLTPPAMNSLIESKLIVNQTHLYWKYSKSKVTMKPSFLLNDRCFCILCSTRHYFTSKCFKMKFNYSVNIVNQRRTYFCRYSVQFRVEFVLKHRLFNLTEMNCNLPTKHLALLNGFIVVSKCVDANETLTCILFNFRITYIYTVALSNLKFDMDILPINKTFYMFLNREIRCIVTPFRSYPFNFPTIQPITKNINIQCNINLPIAFTINPNNSYHLLWFCAICDNKATHVTKCYILRGTIYMIYTPNYPVYYPVYFRYVLKVHFYDNSSNLTYEAMCTAQNDLIAQNDTIKFDFKLTYEPKQTFSCKYEDFRIPDNITLDISNETLKLTILPPVTEFIISPFQFEVTCEINKPELLNYSLYIGFLRTQDFTIITPVKGIIKTLKKRICITCAGGSIPLAESCYDVQNILDKNITTEPSEIIAIEFHSFSFACVFKLDAIYSKRLQVEDITYKIPNNVYFTQVDHTINDCRIAAGTWPLSCTIKVVVKTNPANFIYLNKTFSIFAIDLYNVKLYKPPYFFIVDNKTFKSLDCTLKTHYKASIFNKSTVTVPDIPFIYNNIIKKKACQISMNSTSYIIKLLYFISVILNESQIQLNIQKTPLHFVYLEGAKALFRCYLTPNVTYLFIPPPIMQARSPAINFNVMKTLPYYHNTMNLSDWHAIGFIDLLCQNIYNRYYRAANETIEIISSNVSIKIIEEKRIVYVIRTQSFIYCQRYPAQFNNDKTYISKLHNLSELLISKNNASTFSSPLDYMERNISCTCEVYPGKIIEDKKLVVVIAQYLINLTILTKFDRVIFYMEYPVSFECIFAIPYYGNIDPTIHWSWISRLATYTKVNGRIITINSDHPIGNYSERCVVNITNYLVYYDLSIIVIRKSVVDIIKLTTQNRTVFINIERFEVWCLLYPPELAKYIDYPLPKIKSNYPAINKQIDDNLVVIEPYMIPNGTIDFNCSIVISSSFFVVEFSIEIINESQVKVVFEPENRVYVVNILDSRMLYNCFLIPLRLNSHQYFIPNYTKLFGAHTLDIDKSYINGFNMNESGFYVYTCTFLIANKSFEHQIAFSIAMRSDLAITVKLTDGAVITETSKISIFNKHEVQISLFPRPRYVLIEGNLQFTHNYHSQRNRSFNPEVITFYYNTLFFRPKCKMGTYFFNMSFTINNITTYEDIRIVVQNFHTVQTFFNTTNIVIDNTVILDPILCYLRPSISQRKEKFVLKLIPIRHNSSNTMIDNITNTIIFSGPLNYGEYLYACYLEKDDVKTTFTYIFISVINCSDHKIIISPKERNVFINEKVFCHIETEMTITYALSYDIGAIDLNKDSSNCSQDILSRITGTIETPHGIEMRSVFVNCKIEMICMITSYAGYTMLDNKNISFVRQLVSNISLIFDPDYKIMYINESMCCKVRLNNGTYNYSKYITMVVVNKNNELVLDGIFRVEKYSEGGSYTLRCDYITTYGERKTKTKDVQVHVPPYKLWIFPLEYRVEQYVECKSNGFPQDGFKYQWRLLNGPTNFVFLYKNKLFFEMASDYGYYKITCSLEAPYKHSTYFLESSFIIKLTGYAEKLNYSPQTLRSADWIVKIMLSWVLFLLLLFLGLARYFTYTQKSLQFYGWGLATYYMEELLLHTYVIKFQSPTQLTFQRLTAYIYLVNHYYIPYADEEFFIEYNQSLLDDPYTHDCTEEDLEPLYRLMALFDEHGKVDQVFLDSIADLPEEEQKKKLDEAMVNTRERAKMLRAAEDQIEKHMLKEIPVFKRKRKKKSKTKKESIKLNPEEKLEKKRKREERKMRKKEMSQVKHKMATAADELENDDDDTLTTGNSSYSSVSNVSKLSSYHPSTVSKSSKTNDSMVNRIINDQINKMI